MDATKALGGNSRGYSHIMAMVDSFTGFITLYPLKNVTTWNSAQCLMRYVMLHSMPLEIITDGGPEFRKDLLAQIHDLFDIKHIKIAPYNHRGNGKVETIHAIVKDMLRAYITRFEADWDLLLPYFEFAYNTQKNSVTSYSPFFLQFG